MNNLQIFSRDVIPVYTTSTGEKVVLGRELHERLGIEERYSKWFDRMAGYGFETDADYTPYQTVHPQNQQEITDHLLKLDMAKHIAMIQRSPQGKAIRDKLIQLEMDVSALSPELQCLIRLELGQKQQAKELAAVNQRVEDIRQVVALNPTAWREDARHLITKIAKAWGGNEYIRDVTSTIYDLVDHRGGVSLATRLTNKRQRMAAEGVCKSKRDALTKVDVIAEDKKLTEIYLAVVKEMAIKYGVSVAVA